MGKADQRSRYTGPINGRWLRNSDQECVSPSRREPGRRGRQARCRKCEDELKREPAHTAVNRYYCSGDITCERRTQKYREHRQFLRFAKASRGDFTRGEIAAAFFGVRRADFSAQQIAVSHQRLKIFSPNFCSIIILPAFNTPKRPTRIGTSVSRHHILTHQQRSGLPKVSTARKNIS